MKSVERCGVSVVGRLECGLLILLLAGWSFESRAQSAVLTSANSSIQVNLDPGIWGSAGVYNWAVDGVNQLGSQWFYYRVGNSGPEYSIDYLATPTINSSSANTLDATYAAGGMSIRTAYNLTGQGSGTQKANLGETITLHNASATDHLYFFQYSDFNLANILGNQMVQFYTNVSGVYYKAIQKDASGHMVTETINGLATGLYRVDAGSAGGTLLGLTDGLPTTFSNNLSAGPGNVSFGFEWDVAPGGTIIISKLLAVVPEPSPLALLSVGTLALAWFQRRRARNVS